MIACATLDILSIKMYETEGYTTKIGGADFDNTAKLSLELNFKEVITNVILTMEQLIYRTFKKSAIALKKEPT